MSKLNANSITTKTKYLKYDFFQHVYKKSRLNLNIISDEEKILSILNTIKNITICTNTIIVK